MPDVKLKDVKNEAVVRSFRASDFLSAEEKAEARKAVAKGKKRSYTPVDAYVAEIIARFGYETYEHWKLGDIGEDQMVKYILAERAREAQSRVILEQIIVAAVSGANNPTKGGRAPRSLRRAIEMLKKEEQKARGIDG